MAITAAFPLFPFAGACATPPRELCEVREGGMEGWRDKGGNTTAGSYRSATTPNIHWRQRIPTSSNDRYHTPWLECECVCVCMSRATVCVCPLPTLLMGKLVVHLVVNMENLYIELFISFYMKWKMFMIICCDHDTHKKAFNHVIIYNKLILYYVVSFSSFKFCKIVVWLKKDSSN